MTRETKVGLAIAGSFLSLVGVVVTARMNQSKDSPKTDSSAVARAPEKKSAPTQAEEKTTEPERASEAPPGGKRMQEKESGKAEPSGAAPAPGPAVDNGHEPGLIPVSHNEPVVPDLGKEDPVPPPPQPVDDGKKKDKAATKAGESPPPAIGNNSVKNNELAKKLNEMIKTQENGPDKLPPSETKKPAPVADKKPAETKTPAVAPPDLGPAPAPSTTAPNLPIPPTQAPAAESPAAQKSTAPPSTSPTPTVPLPAAPAPSGTSTTASPSNALPTLPMPKTSTVEPQPAPGPASTPATVGLSGPPAIAPPAKGPDANPSVPAAPAKLSPINPNPAPIAPPSSAAPGTGANTAAPPVPISAGQPASTPAVSPVVQATLRNDRPGQNQASLPQPGPSPANPPTIGTVPQASIPTIGLNAPGEAPAKVRSYDVESYETTARDKSFADLSRRIYGIELYSPALLLFNRDHPLASESIKQNPPVLRPGMRIYYPAADVLKSKYPQLFSAPSVQANNSSPAVQVGTPTPVTSTPGNPAAVAGPPPGTQVMPATWTSSDNTMNYRVRDGGERLYDVAQNFLGDGNRWPDIYRLNRDLQPAYPIPGGTVIKLPQTANAPGNGQASPASPPASRP